MRLFALLKRLRMFDVQDDSDLYKVNETYYKGATWFLIPAYGISLGVILFYPCEGYLIFRIKINEERPIL